MSDIVLESFRAAILLYLLVYLIREGREREELCREGWRLVIAGFAFLLFGNVMDISDNFGILNRFIVVGDTPSQAFLEKIVGSACGFLMLTIGLVRWMPTITSVESTYRMNAELQHREEKYRTLYESSRDAIMTLAPPEWSFTSCNPATVDLFRVRDEAEFVSLGPWQLSPETQADGTRSEEKAREMIEAAMRDGSHFFEWIHTHSDGTPFPAEVLLTRLVQGDQVLLQATVRNISDRKLAEEALRESEERYRHLFDHMSSGVAVYQPVDNGADFVFKGLNASGARIEGIDREDAIGRKVTAVFPGIRDMGLLSVLQHVWKTGEPEHLPVSHYVDDRLDGWRENYVYRLPSGEIVAIYDDVTESKLAELALAESKERLEDLVSSLPFGVTIIDEETHEILDVNPKALSMFGRTIDPGTVCHQFICPAEKGRCPLTDLGQDIDNSERVLLDADGTHVPVVKTVIPMVLNDRKCLIECFIDITEHKRAEVERLQNEKLKGVLETAGAVCHEINQPLQSISGYADLLSMDVGDDGPLHEKISIISEQVGRIAEITRKLSRITKYETMAYLDRTIVDIHKAAEEIELTGQETVG